MIQQIPSPDDTKAYTALAIDVYSGSFCGRHFSDCALTDYHDAVLSTTFDMSKLDFWQKESVAGKEKPYTVLSAAINMKEFHLANEMLSELRKRHVSPKRLLEALDLHHSRAMLHKVIYKPTLITDDFRRGQGQRFVTQLKEMLPRRYYYEEILKEPYPYEMAQEDREYEQEKIIRDVEKPALEPRIIIKEQPLKQSDFMYLLFRER